MTLARQGNHGEKNFSVPTTYCKIYSHVSSAVASELKDSLITDTPPVEDESPWAAFNSFTPVNLKRTASNFIKEFENSLTPPPQSPNNGHDNSEMQLSKDKIISDNEARLLLNNLP